MGLQIESMGMFLEGFIRREFEDQNLDDDEIAVLKAVMHYELYTSTQIREILKQRAQQVLGRLRQGPPP
jgi:hypothetical protein